MKKITILGLSVFIGVAFSSVLANAEFGSITNYAKISDTDGGFDAPLTNYDRFGASIANIGDINGDLIDDIAIGAPYADDGAASRGEVYILFLNEDGTIKTSVEGEDDGAAANGYTKISDTSGGLTATFTTGDLFGVDVEGLGDLNGDGVRDIAVGAMANDTVGTDKGAVFILFLNANGTIDTSVVGKADGGAVNGYTKLASGSGDLEATLINFGNFGSSLAVFDDLNGDGIQDLGIGSRGAGSIYRGAVFIVFLDTDGSAKESVVGVNEGGAANGYSKISATSGDFNGALATIDYFGTSLAVVDDINGDGVQDMVVGAPDHDESGGSFGAIFVLFMESDGTVDETVEGKFISATTNGYTKISPLSGEFTATFSTQERFGSSISSMGDINGDGVPDIAVGATGDNDGGTNRGAVFLLYLTENGTLSQTQVGADNEDEVVGYSKISGTSGDFSGTIYDAGSFGAAVASVGDVDDDGIADVFVGVPNDLDGGTSKGGIFSIQFTSFINETRSTRDAQVPYVLSAEVFGNPACKSGLYAYVAVRGTHISQVIIANNEQFLGASVDAFNTSANPVNLIPYLSLPNSTVLVPFIWTTNGGNIYLTTKSGTGNLGEMVHLELNTAELVECSTLDPVTEVIEDETEMGEEDIEEAEEIEVGEEDDVQVDEETENDSEGESVGVYKPFFEDLVLEEGTRGPVYYIDAQNYKRPFRYFYIFHSWKKPIDEIQVVSKENMQAIRTREPMLFKGPTLVRYMTKNEIYYVDRLQNQYIVGNEGILPELFGEGWANDVELLPHHMYKDRNISGSIGRYSGEIIREWKTYRDARAQ